MDTQRPAAEGGRDHGTRHHRLSTSATLGGSALSDFVLALLTNASFRDAFLADPKHQLVEYGLDDVSGEDVVDTVEALRDQLPADDAARLEPYLRAAGSDDTSDPTSGAAELVTLARDEGARLDTLPDEPLSGSIDDTAEPIPEKGDPNAADDAEFGTSQEQTTDHARRHHHRRVVVVSREVDVQVHGGLSGG